MSPVQSVTMTHLTLPHEGPSARACHVAGLPTIELRAVAHSHGPGGYGKDASTSASTSRAVAHLEGALTLHISSGIVGLLCFLLALELLAGVLDRRGLALDYLSRDTIPFVVFKPRDFGNGLLG